MESKYFIFLLLFFCFCVISNVILNLVSYHDFLIKNYGQYSVNKLTFEQQQQVNTFFKNYDNSLKKDIFIFYLIGAFTLAMAIYLIEDEIRYNYVVSYLQNLK